MLAQVQAKRNQPGGGSESEWNTRHAAVGSSGGRNARGLLFTCLGLRGEAERSTTGPCLELPFPTSWLHYASPQPLVPGMSSSEDESPSLVTKRTPLRKFLKHSTPEDVVPGWSPRPSGDATYLGGSPVSARFSQDLVSNLVGVSPLVTFRKRRLSTIRAFKGSSEQSGPDSDPSDPVEKTSVSNSLPQQQRGKSLQAKSWRQNPGLPGIPNTARKKKRDPKKLAAAMKRVRQWEFRLLQDIEEAIQHELTIQEDCVLGSGTVLEESLGPPAFT
ncbi:coiled-coil domain-containing protein 201 [Nycticebus coucang]|uniref:coiled-coil domain-containing protein 201 n=1 Tax=Nycticebus coucang TaxID=9470 RepID=UPI00234DBC16|nr:coiled-coil domain-containing protein 201 [Nycticebus coucang]